MDGIIISKVFFREIGCDVGKLVEPTRDTVQWTSFEKHSNEPSGSLRARNILAVCVTISFQIRPCSVEFQYVLM